MQSQITKNHSPIKILTAVTIICLALIQATGLKAQSTKTDSVKPGTVVIQSPQFPGGIHAFGEFLGKNIKYPQEAKDKKIQGRVILAFVVETDGQLSEIKAVSSPDESLSKEAIRVMSQSPKWKPGTQQGKPTRMHFTVPISFSLDGR
jgi:protein TonB